MCRTPRDVVTGPASGEPAHGLGAQSLHGIWSAGGSQGTGDPCNGFQPGWFPVFPDGAYHASGAAAAYLNSRYFLFYTSTARDAETMKFWPRGSYVNTIHS